MPAEPTDTAADLAVVHVARQPIYDRGGRIVAYELLFRGRLDAVDAARRDTYATSQVIINAFTEFGIRDLTGNRPGFINLTREFLTGELPLPFGPEGVVLEVLETVPIDEQVIAGVAGLVEAGYRIALDDFVLGLGHDRLLGLAGYVKLDMLDADTERLDALVAACRAYPQLTFVAEKLENDVHLALADRYRCELRQGYVLDRPLTLSTASLAPSKLRLLELLAILANPDADLEQVLTIIANDPALSLRVLRACGSAAAGVSGPISSLRQAVVLLGRDQVRNWAILMTLDDLTTASEDQLVDIVARARLSHHLAATTGAPPDAAFTASLIVGAAALLNRDPTTVTGQLPLDTDIIEALTTGTGPIGRALHLAGSYGDGASTEHVDAGTTHAYLSALSWATAAVQTTHEQRAA